MVAIETCALSRVQGKVYTGTLQSLSLITGEINMHDTGGNGSRSGVDAAAEHGSHEAKPLHEYRCVI